MTTVDTVTDASDDVYLTCPFCDNPMDFPAYSQPTFCHWCDKKFVLAADFGWFRGGSEGYTLELYVPES